MARDYPDPWVPKTFSTWIVKGSANQRSTNRAADFWDVKAKVDGVLCAKRFRKAGLAQAWKDRIDRDFPRGLPFDPRTKQSSRRSRPRRRPRRACLPSLS